MLHSIRYKLIVSGRVASIRLGKFKQNLNDKVGFLQF